MFIIDNSEVEKLVENKCFDILVKECEKLHIDVKTDKDLSSLYLLFSNNVEPKEKQVSGDVEPKEKQVSGDVEPNAKEVSGDVEPNEREVSSDVEPNEPEVSGDVESNEREVSGDVEPNEVVNLHKLSVDIQCNGIILEKGTNKVVCACQNKFINTTKEEMKKHLLKIGKNVVMHKDADIRVEYCEDGTVMRLYNYKGNWYTATTKCINAKNSYWSSEKTFDDMFWELFDNEYLKQLDTNYTYVFILLHSDNRIVVKHNKSNLVYISRISNENFQEDYKNMFPFTWRPRSIPYFNLEDISNYFWPQKRGILIKIHENNTWTTYKIDFEKYLHIKEIRGNLPNIKTRYLQLLKDNEKQKELEKYYYEHKKMFEGVRKEIFNLVKSIHKLYVNSHIKHTTKVTEEHMLYRTLRQLHAQYKKTNKPISYEDVYEKLRNLDTNLVKKFLEW